MIIPIKLQMVDPMLAKHATKYAPSGQFGINTDTGYLVDATNGNELGSDAFTRQFAKNLRGDEEWDTPQE